MATTFRNAGYIFRPRHHAGRTHSASPLASLTASFMILLGRALRHCVLPTASTTIMVDQMKRRLAEARRRSAEASSHHRRDPAR